MNDKMIVFDTSVFMERLDVVECLSQQYNILFPIVVADELNHLKESRDDYKSYKARRAIRYIRNHSSDWDCDYTIYSEENDMSIIKTAMVYSASLATLDIGMELRASGRGVDLIDISCHDKDYKGYKLIQLNSEDESDMELLAEYYENKDNNIFDCLTNEYVIIKQDGETIDTSRWNGETYVDLIETSKSVKALTDEQKLAIDLLMNDDIPIKVIYGSAGSGKTYLSVKLGLEMVKGYDAKYDKLVLVRNPLGSGEKIGYLKGDKYDKIIDFYKPFQQHFDGDYLEFETMIAEGRLEIEIPYFMKGLDISNSLVIFDEAEDSDEKLMRLVGTRLAKGSSIVVLGDSKQAESKFSENSNGLTKLVERAKGSEMFGCVYLTEDLRSSASKLFAGIF